MADAPSIETENTDNNEIADITTDDVVDETADPLAESEIDLPVFEGAIEPTLWDDLRDSLPYWIDEVLAISLLIFGVLSFLALFDSSGAVVAITGKRA
ncbi:MAG: hypothetical protein AAFR67_08555 [Chloroflexota bacterium]